MRRLSMRGVSWGLGEGWSGGVRSLGLRGRGIAIDWSDDFDRDF